MLVLLVLVPIGCGNNVNNNSLYGVKTNNAFFNPNIFLCGE